MKKNRSLVIGLTVFSLIVLAVGACRKEAADVMPGNKTAVHQGAREVQQKFYDVSDERLKEIALSMRNGHHASARLIEDDSIPIDSSIWVIEAALNYDLDMTQDADYETENFTSTIDVAVNEATMRIGSNEIDFAYDQLKTQIQDHVDPTHVIMAVDMTATLSSANTLTFEAQYIVAVSVNVQICNGIPLDGTTYLSVPVTLLNTISPSLVTCGGTTPSSPDAPARLTKALNCKGYKDLSCYRLTYVNVVTDLKASGFNVAYNAYPNALYATQMYNCSTWCTTPASTPTLTDVQVAGFYSNLVTLANSVVPGGSTRIQCTVTSGKLQGANSFCGFYYSLGWNLNTMYGVRRCNYWPPQ